MLQRAGGTELGGLERFAQQEDAGDADNAKHLGSKQDDPKFRPARRLLASELDPK